MNRSTVSVTVFCLILAGGVSTARGQVIFQSLPASGPVLSGTTGDAGLALLQAQQGGGPFLLAPAGNQGPLFLEGNAGVAAPVGTPVQAGGMVNGTPLITYGTLPAVFPGNLRVDLGFEYLRPDFPSRAVTLTIPGSVNNNFSALAGSGNPTFDFGFVPKITMGYQFPDLGYGVTASGEVLSVSGHLSRTIDSVAGSANLTAAATVNIGVANLLEGSLRYELDQYPFFDDCCLHDAVLLLTLGARYSHLSQDYQASLSSGPNTSSIAAHQDWDGFGLTTSASFIQPLRHDFFLYGVSRGSFMLGTNNRFSTLTVVVPNDSAATTSSKLTENKTDFIPVGEFEVGLAWGRPIWGRTAPALAAANTETAPVTGPILWVKAGFIADVWGSLGLLAPQSGVSGFSGSTLFLYGFSVMAGLDF